MESTALVKNYHSLKSERKTLDSVLQVIRQFFVPFRGEFFDDDSSENSVEWRDMRQVYDTTGISSADRLAANVQAAMASPSTKWFKFKFRDEKLNDNHESRVWLEECEDIVYQELKDSNFDVESSEFYLDLVSFGTAVISEEAESELEWKGLDFSAIPMADCYFEENSSDGLLRFYRKYEWTPAQICDKFDNAPEWITTNKEKAATEKIEVVFCVYERAANKNADTSSVLESSARPFGFKYIIVKDASILGDIGGYYDMPAYVARWRKVSGSKWGYGPAHIALSDALTLNQITEDTLEALGKVIDPAILTTSRGLLSDLDLRRSGVTVVKDVKDVVPFESKARFDVGELKTERLQAAIRSAFYTDQLELKDSPAMTATEVNARADMVLKLMGPTSGRIQNDFLDPCLQRTFKILFRAGMLPDVPGSVSESGSEMDIEYTGPMPRAQRDDLVQAINRWIGSLMQQAEVNPSVMDIPDWDAIARETASLAGVPTRLTRSSKSVEAQREAQQQQAEQQRALENAKIGGEASVSMQKATESGAPK